MSASKHPGKPPQHKSKSATSTRHTGTVIVNYGKNLLVEDEQRQLFRCVARRSLGLLVCGDRVEWARTGDTEGVIESCNPRDTVLHRADSNNRLRPLAANIDRVVIEAATEPALDTFLIDKYLVAAELAGLRPLLVINKADLLSEEQRHAIDQMLQIYREAGYTCLFTSALENTGIDQFREQLSNSTSILVGQSGVGKSSLIKRLLPDQEIAIGKLSEASGLGKHTTTATTLYHLPDGGKLIDSPGVRDFHLGGVNPEQLGSGFREFHPFLGQCRFNDCLHLSEPDCAISDALESGRISQQRMASYRRLIQL